MVEEDEEELLNDDRNDSEYHSWKSPLQGSYLPCKTPCSNATNKWKGKESFADENKNPDKIMQTPCSLNRHESLNQKIDFLGVEDGYFTQPLKDASSLKNQVARRSLHFDSHQKLKSAETWISSSPLPQTALDFGLHSSMMFEEEEDKDGSTKGSKLITRSRLQVFQDLTP